MDVISTPPLPIRSVGPDVFAWTEPIVHADRAVIDFLKREARRSVRKRSRLCGHASVDAAVHEMLIVHHRDVYVRPHRHIAKSESFHLIEGDAVIALFADDGSVNRLLTVASRDSSCFYVRIPPATYHSFIILSEWLVFHETTAGPFDRSEMEFAPWSPRDDEGDDIARLSAEIAAAAREER